ncbi:MAG: sodium:proton exchanger, partial [Thermoanaerobaculia bacterium]
GARLGARFLGLGLSVRKFLGMGLLAQAGLAIGLVITTQRRFGTFAPTVTAIVLASVVVYEMFGPLCTRFALVRSGEARPAESEALVI